MYTIVVSCNIHDKPNKFINETIDKRYFVQKVSIIMFSKPTGGFLSPN